MQTLSGPAKAFLQKDIKELDQLKYVLAPILARSAAEQETFYNIWEQYYEELKAPLQRSQSQSFPDGSTPLSNWVKWPLRILGATITAFFFYYIFQPQPPVPKINFQHQSIVKVGDTIRTNNISEIKDSLNFKFLWELVDAENGETEHSDSSNYHWQFVLKERGNSPNKKIRLSAREIKTDSFYTVEKTLTISCKNPPQITRINAPKQIQVNEPVNFLADLMGSTNIVYEWDFGDDSPLSNEVEPSHQYDKSGQYTVRLTITEPDGADEGICQHSQTHLIQVGVGKAFLPLLPLLKDEVIPIAKVGLGSWLLLWIPFLFMLFYFAINRSLSQQNLESEKLNKSFFRVSGLTKESLKETGEQRQRKKALIFTCKVFFFFGLFISTILAGLAFTNILWTILLFIFVVGVVLLIENGLINFLRSAQFNLIAWLSIFWSLLLSWVMGLPLTWAYTSEAYPAPAFTNAFAFYFCCLFPFVTHSKIACSIF